MDKKKIDELKKKHGAIYQIDVETDVSGEYKSCIIRKPNRKDLSYVSAVKNNFQAMETLLRQLWIEGDEEILTDDDLFLGATNQMGEILKIREGQIKKL